MKTVSIRSVTNGFVVIDHSQASPAPMTQPTEHVFTDWQQVTAHLESIEFIPAAQ